MLLKSCLTAFLAVSNFLLSLYTVYTLVLALFSFRRKEKPAPARQPRTRFACLIAARNEEKVLGQLLASLRQQDYPADLFTVFVVPNNCTDKTESVARRAGAKIMLPAGRIRSKGDVLEFAFKKLLRCGGFDAICVIDADNLVHPGFLTAMDRALLSGSDLVQGYRDSKNPHDNGLAGSYSLYFWALNRFLNRSRHNLGLAVPLGGSGFAITTDLLRRLPDLSFRTMTEDMELSIFCQLAGARSSWAADAIIYDEQPLSFAQSWRQRSRWSSGMYQIGALYTRQLLRHALHEPSLASLDLVMLYSSALVQVLAFCSMAGSFILSLAGLASGLVTVPAFLSGLFIPFALALAVSSLLALFVVILEKKLRRGIWRGICTFWFFLASWMPINLWCLFFRPGSWQQIHHQRNIRYQDLNS